MNDTTTRTAPKAAVILTPAAEQRVAARAPDAAEAD